MKLVQLILVVFLAVITAFATTRYWPSHNAALVVQETAFNRVTSTGVLRCGYYVLPPVTMREPNTGKLSGLSVDMMEYVAQKTGLKVEWSEEISFGNWIAGLQAKRFDAVCTPMWADVTYNRAAKFTRSMFYTSVEPFIRSDETRFTSTDPAQLNKPDVTIAVQEGNVTASLARTLFPLAKFIELPQNSDYGTVVQEVIGHKADVVIWDRNGFFQYNKNNPDKIKPLHLDQPLKVMPFELATLQGEIDLRDFLDGAVEDTLNTGEMDRLLKKWEDIPGAYLRAAKPYQ